MEETAAWNQASAADCFNSTAEVGKELFLSALSAMKSNNISSVARHDHVILHFGAAILEKVGKRNANCVSQWMCPLARFLVILRAIRYEKAATLESLSTLLKLITNYRPIGVPHSNQVHVSWYPINIPIKTNSISSKTDQDKDQETWILTSLNMTNLQKTTHQN